jgi:putative membrane protein
MKTNSKNFFSDGDLESVRAAVERAEKTTSGEIAVMVVDQSDSYREAATLGAVLLAALMSLVIEFLVMALPGTVDVWTHSSAPGTLHLIAEYSRYVSLWTFIPVVFLLYFPVIYLLNRVPGIKLLFVGNGRINEAVRERALRAFYERRLYRTRDETGILLFITILERRVWIIGDRGINAKIAPDHWKALAAELASGIKAGKPAQAACSVIGRCGEELTRHFPIKADDTNELSNEVITGD